MFLWRKKNDISNNISQYMLDLRIVFINVSLLKDFLQNTAVIGNVKSNKYISSKYGYTLFKFIPRRYFRTEKLS